MRVLKVQVSVTVVLVSEDKGSVLSKGKNLKCKCNNAKGLLRLKTYCRNKDLIVVSGKKILLVIILSRRKRNREKNS